MRHLTNPKNQLIAALALIALVYLFTRPPSILWIDSGTMIAAASEMGIPNPPGFPFYMMVGHLFTLLPFSKLFSLQLLSIISSITLLFLIYQIIKMLLGEGIMYHVLRIKEEKPTVHNTKYIIHNTNTAHYSALFGMISLAFSYQYWSQTQNTEAFIFSYMFVTLFAYLLLKVCIKYYVLSIKGKKQEDKNQNSHNTNYIIHNTNSKQLKQTYSKALFRTLLLIAFLYGLAAGANPTVASFVPGVLFVMWLNRKYLTLGKLVILGSVFAITLACVYAYLPIRASSWPFVNWGNPQTWELFVGHLHGAGLNIYEPQSDSINGFTGSPLIFFQSISYWLLNVFLQFSPILVPFLVAGLIFVYRANKYLFAYLLVVPAFDVIYSGLYLSGNQESWFILSWIFFAIFIGLGFYFIVFKLLKNLKSLKYLVLLFSLAFLPLLLFFPILNRHNHYYSSDYAHNLYDPLEKDAILIGTGDFFNALSHYSHEADILRPDVTPVTANVFYVNRWYRDGLRHATNLSISDKIEAIIQYKDYWEYNAAMNQFIDENIKEHPIYVTQLTLRASALAATSGGQLKLDDRYKFVPYGLVLKVVYATEEAKPNLDLFNFNFKSDIKNWPNYLERNYKGAFANILGDYTYAYEFLADWFAERNDDQNAQKYYRKADDISKGQNGEVLAHLGEFFARRKDFNASYQYLQKAERLDVKNPTIHFNLGLSYANMGMNEEAIREFQSISMLVDPGSEMAGQAEQLVRQLSAIDLNNRQASDELNSWQTIESKKNNFKIKAPKEFKKVTEDNANITVFSNNLPSNEGLMVEGYYSELAPNDNIEKVLEGSPLKMTGVLLDTQQIQLEGFVAAVQVFGTPTGDSSQRYILIKDNKLWQFRVTPGNSTKVSEFYKMLGTFTPAGSM